jgi:uncharacterized protein GlcG (DUF336 family)
MVRFHRCVALVSAAALVLSGCGGGAGGSSAPAATTTPPVTAVYTPPAAEALTVSDVQQILAQAIAEAKARGAPAVISVTDRVGNVLAAYQMVGAPSTLVIRAGPGGPTNQVDLQGISVPGALVSIPEGPTPPATQPVTKPGSPAVLAAIAKAITGAYLSSSGNAFSTRTASEIVQDTFPPSPQTVGLGSGPLFGVQFSSLPCSDLQVPIYLGAPGLSASIGPKPSPLGLSGDPGGFPLYKNGVVVGGIGVKADSDYGFDPNIDQTNNTQISEEAIALAGTVGFDAPTSIRADQITVGGNSLIYSDATLASLMSTPASAPAFSTLTATTGSLVAVVAFYPLPASGVLSVLPGQAYGTEASGIRKSTTAEFNNPDAYVLSNGTGADRYVPKAGTDAADVGTPLTAAEVTSLLQNAFTVMSNARANIRNPLNSRAEVTISVVDTHGAILGIVRAPDAPIFGIDVSLQRARTASFFSGAFAASDLAGFGDDGGVSYSHQSDVQGAVAAMRNFLGDQTALTGKTAFSVRSIAGLARPTFPDGQVGTANGPLSHPLSIWSIFATGTQTALVDADLIDDLIARPDPTTGVLRARCTQLPDVVAGQNRLQNGIQIFSGGEPIYRNGVLIGGIGVSGDGTSQDDMIGFLGIDGAHGAIGTVENAPPAIRADELNINQGGGVNHVIYVSCPPSPFLNSSIQDPCTGK